ALSTNLVALLDAAVGFANPNNGELVVDIEALVSGALNMTAKSRIPSSPDWVKDWAREQGYLFAFRSSTDTDGLPITFSYSVRERVLQRAIALRDRTMMLEAPELGPRHLLFALAEEAPISWPPLADGGRPSPESFAVLRTLIVERTARDPLHGEDMAAWRQLLNEKKAESKSQASELTPLLSDNPSVSDLLGRRPLAQALAMRLRRLQAEEAKSPEPAAIMVHLHGAWGSGKSSMARMLTAELSNNGQPWLVVDFNAWRSTRVKPPWWNMLTLMKREVSARLARDRYWLGWIRLQLRWLWWQASQELLLLMLGSGLLLLSLLFGLGLDALGKGVEQLGKLISGAGGVILLGRARLLGGGRGTAEAFDALRTDSFRPFIHLFAILNRASPAPVLIVLDDLDRCDASTVTDLLEGIQTLFRGAPVVFLAVADRRWITSSFEERFKLFADNGQPARPIGDMFLDKIFQLSLAVPEIRPRDQEIYLRHLLGVRQQEGSMNAPPPLAPEVTTLEAGQAAIQNAAPGQASAVAAQVALRLSEQVADDATQHRLLDRVEFIEANPRSIKRLINAIGMAQTRIVIERRLVDFDTVVLWTNLELRWPMVAEWISTRWNQTKVDLDQVQNLGAWLLHTAKDHPPQVKQAMFAPAFTRAASELDFVSLSGLLGNVDISDVEPS
ncbi:MAG: P-loop NTPase fold protein, partial [Sphingomonadales bacterium]